MKTNLLIIALVSLVLVACKKEPLPPLPPETGPYYSIQGYVGGTLIDMNVGQEGVLTSQGATTENGVTYYFGQIVSPSEDLLIRIDFAKPEVPLTSSGFKAFNGGNISYMIHEPGCKTFTFGGSSQQSNFLLVKNEFGDFEPVTEVSYDEFGIHTATLKFTDVSSNSFQVPVSYGFDNVQMNTGFQAFPNADSVIFSAVDLGLYHDWYVNGSFVGSGSSIVVDPLPIGIHKVEHKVRDDYNNEASQVTLMRITDYVLDWKMDINNCTGPPSSNYGKVIVTVLTDGQEYKSSYAAGNVQNSFIVSDIDYIGNSSIEPTRAVFDLNFDALLINEANTDSLSLSSMSGTFNVGLH